MALLRAVAAMVYGRDIKPEESPLRKQRDAKTEAAKRRAKAEGRLYDAYPDSPSPKVAFRLVIIGGRLMEKVDLGYPLEEINLDAPSWHRKLAKAVKRAETRLAARLLLRAEEKRRKRLLRKVEKGEEPIAALEGR